jgi:acyl-CoA synthetase (AMP-forming)/AMP-acid ligase II
MPLSGARLDQPIPITDLLRRGLETMPDEAALITAKSRWSWRGLDEASNRLAGHLLAMGLRPGDRVASLMPNRSALVVHYLACLKAGLVATPLNYRYMPPEIDHALEVSGAAVLFAHSERDRDVAASKLAGRLPLGLIRYGAGAGPNDKGLHFEELIDRQPPALSLPAADQARPAFILFTSGSTGPAKGVTHTSETLAWILASTAKGLGYTANDVVLPGSSFSHLGAIGFSFPALAAGARVVIPRTCDGDELLPLLRQHRPTVLWMLPAALIRLVREHGACRQDFSSVRLCISGGDKVAPQLEREFTDLTGFPIDEIYGMTECHCASVNPPSGVNKLGSVGRLSPGYNMSIRDDAGVERPPGEHGRLWIKSPCNTVGYWNNPESTAATIRDGWLDTGDVMMVDQEGYLWFRGRKKQIIVHDGSNICPQEVENALLEHAAVECAGVVGVHDLVHGENVRAYVTFNAGAARPTSQEMIQFARARVGYKAPEEIVVLDKMPLNTTGKLDRMALKRLAEARLAGQPER